MHKQEVEALNLRSPELWLKFSPEDMWAQYRAHLNRELDAVLPQGRPNAVVRLSEPDAPVVVMR